MNIKLNNVVIFTMGVFVGVAASWKYLEKKYHNLSIDEVDQVREYYKTKLSSEVENEASETVEQESLKEEKYEPKTTEEQMKCYDKLLGKYRNEKKEEPKIMKEPYVISPDDFGDMDYEIKSLDYYADGTLIDDLGDVVEDKEELIGDALDHFGEYEDDSVFVRDDVNEIDYEILRDSRCYYENTSE